MPRPGWHKHTFTGPRPWESIEVSPFNDVPDVSRGEMRLAAEAVIAKMSGYPDVPDSVYLRASQTLRVLAAG